MENKKLWVYLGVTFLVLVLLVVLLAQKKEAPIVDLEENNPELQYQNQIEGNWQDLVNFSVLPNTRLSGVVAFDGEVKGGYFFEGNILINILDTDKNVLKAGNATATSDWMTAEPVAFAGEIDLTGLPLGTAYLEIRNDNPAGPEEGVNKNILIPIVIE